MKSPDPTSLVNGDMRAMIHIAATCDTSAGQWRTLLERWLDEKDWYLGTPQDHRES